LYGHTFDTEIARKHISPEKKLRGFVVERPVKIEEKERGKYHHGREIELDERGKRTTTVLWTKGDESNKEGKKLTRDQHFSATE